MPNELKTTAALCLLLLLGCGDPANENAGPPEPPPPLPPEPAFEIEDGFTAIGLADCTVFDSKPTDGSTWLERNGRLECVGEPKGYLYTNDSYEDFTLRFDYRFPEPDKAEDPTKLNTGVLVFITGEHRAWPKCLEVQGRFDEMAHVKSNARDVTVDVEDDPAARKQARKPAGEWNTVEVVSKGGALTSYLNGEKIAESQPTELTTGPIGFQSELNPVHFRYVRIRRN